MSENKKFRIQNGVDIRGEMSFGDQVVVDDSLNITGKTITADTFEGDGSNLTGVVKPSDLNTLIDSDYIQERVVLDGVGIDSADAQLLIDVEKNRAQSAEQVNATAIQSNTNAIDAERQARIEGDQLAVNGRTVQFATLEAMISAEETRATVAEAGLSQDIVDSTSLSISGDSDLQSQINSIKAGDTEFTGDLIPDQDNVHSLGSETKMWKDVYVGPGSLYINGQKVIEDNSGTITVNADPGQNLSLNTSGGGAIDLNSGDESVQIRSDLIISSSKTISTAGGAATKFGGDVDMQSNQIGNLGAPLQSTDAATKQYVDSVIAVPHTGTKTFDDDVVIGGTLTVKGSTTTIESETLSVADNMVDLNSNMTSGTPTENAGIRVLRGDESPKSFLWKESQGTWSAEGPITATTYYGDGSNLVGIDVYTDADVTALVDSDYVQSRVVIPESGTDSAEVISLIPTQIEAYNSANNVHFSGTNVGIGTNSPATTLDVEGNITLSGSNGKIYLPQTPNNFNWIGDVIEQTGIVIVPTNDDTSERITFAVNNSEAMRIDASGNLLVGLTTGGKFSVSYGGNDTHFGLGANYDNYITAGASGVNIFRNGTTERMRIDSSGKVGIGVSNPSSYYAENLVVAAADEGGITIVSDPAHQAYLMFADGTTGSQAYRGYIGYDHGNDFLNIVSSGVMRFYSGDPATEAMRIDSSGQVGIGTSSPSRALEVSTDGTAQFRLSRVDSSINGNNTIGSIEFMGTDDTAGTIGASIVAHASSTWGAGAYPTDLRFSTMTGSTLSERMRIDASGQLLLGRGANVASGAEATRIQFYNTASTYDTASIRSLIGAGQVNRGELSFAVNNGAGQQERMRLDYIGNLLVGKTGTANLAADTTAGHTLYDIGVARHVASGSPSLQLTRTSSDGDIAVFTKDGTTVGSIGCNGAAIHLASGTTGIRVISDNTIRPSDASGAFKDNAIDLGAANARWKDLHLSGFINVGNDIRMKQTNPRIDYDNGSSGALRFFSTSANSERMRLTSDGNLLVGKDVNDLTTDGVVLRGSGELFVTRANDVAAFNRRSSDGDIVTFRRDGTTVGSIGVDSGNNLYIGGSAASHAGLYFGTRVAAPINAGTLTDAVMNLGDAGYRFKDLHLSGNAYIGGNTAIHSGNLSELGILHKAGGGAYYRPDNWIDFGSNNEIGLYWSSGAADGWHLYPQDKAHMTVRSGASTHSGLVLKCNDDTPRGYFYADYNNNVGILTADANWALRIDNDKNAHLEGDLYVNNGQGIKLRTSVGNERGSISAHEGTSNLRISTSNGESIAFYDGTTENMRIDGGGNVSVTGTITESSSITYKENVDPITNALELVTQLVGVTYDRKDGSAKDRAGLIAEQVNEVLPNVVKKNEEGGAEAIAYTNLIAYLIESVKELKSEIDELRGK